VTVVDHLRMLGIHDGFGRKKAAAPLRLIAIPRLTLIKHRLPEADAFIVRSSHPMSLLEELQAGLLAKTGFGNESGPIEAHIAAAISSQTEEPTLSTPNTTPDPPAIEPDSSTTEGR
jgi:hypothetical protein